MASISHLLSLFSLLLLLTSSLAASMAPFQLLLTSFATSAVPALAARTFDVVVVFVASHSVCILAGVDR